jgi:hypothetical protein
MPWRRIGEWRYSATHSLTSALDGCEWSASQPRTLYPQRKSPWYPIVQPVPTELSKKYGKRTTRGILQARTKKTKNERKGAKATRKETHHPTEMARVSRIVSTSWKRTHTQSRDGCMPNGSSSYANSRRHVVTGTNPQLLTPSQEVEVSLFTTKCHLRNQFRGGESFLRNY